MCGSLHVRRVFEAAGRTLAIAELGTLTYVSRTLTPGTVDVYLRAAGVPFSTVPDDDEVAHLVEDLLPGQSRATHPMEVWFWDVNMVLHPPGMILGAARIESTGGEFHFYGDGITDSVEAVMTRLDEERVEVARAFGAVVPRLAEAMATIGTADAEAARTGKLGDAIRSGAANATIKAPQRLDHRYLNEDIPFGLVPLAALGRIADVPTPVANGLIELAGVINSRSYMTDGLNEHALGIRGASVDEVTGGCGRQGMTLWQKLTIAILGGDGRETEMASLATDAGASVRLFGAPPSNRRDVTTAASLAEALDGARIAILPIPYPGADGALYAPFAEGPIHITADDLSAMAADALVITGKSDAFLDAAAEKAHVIVREYENDTDLMLLRAPAIAEGAIRVAIEHSPVTVHGTQIGLVGFGRIGSALTRSLIALNANVHVFARRGEARAGGLRVGSETAPFRRGPPGLSGARDSLQHGPGRGGGRRRSCAPTKGKSGRRPRCSSGRNRFSGCTRERPKHDLGTWTRRVGPSHGGTFAVDRCGTYRAIDHHWTISGPGDVIHRFALERQRDIPRIAQSVLGASCRHHHGLGIGGVG